MSHGSNHFIPWLRTQLDAQTFDGCKWVNKDQDVYQIAWPRANADTDIHGSLGVMYAWYKHKFGDSRLGIQPTAVKGNFRSCLNSKKREITQLHDHREGNITWKVMRFQRLPPGEKKKQKKRQHTTSNEQLISKPELVSPYDSPYNSPAYMYPGPSTSNSSSNMATSPPTPAQVPYYPYNVTSDPSSPPAPEEVVMQAHGWFPEWLTKQQISDNFLTSMRVEIYNRGRMIGEHTFPDMENKKLHIFYNKRTRQEDLWAPVDVFAPECMECPFTFEPIANQPVSDKLTMLGKYFSPGVIVSCDANANIGLQRISPSHIYYSNPQEKHWVKLEKPRREAETNEVLFDLPQQVFGYQEYIYVGEYWAETKEQSCETGVHYLPYQILMTIGEEPQKGYGFNDCELGIKIIHSKAEYFFNNRIRPLLPPDGPLIKISDELAALTVDDQRDWSNYIEHAHNFGGTHDVDLDALLQTDHDML